MKTPASKFPRVARNGGFTLPEVIIASALMILLTGGVISTFIFGIRMQREAEIKLGANDSARKTVLTIADEIRGATRVQVGTGGATNFTEAASTNSQVGPALQILSSSDTNSWVRYYCEKDPTSTNYSRLCRTTSTMGGQYSIVVSHSMINPGSMFSSEDSYGNALNNNQNNRVVGINLQLYQVPFENSPGMNSKLGDSYQLRTRITRRRLY